MAFLGAFAGNFSLLSGTGGVAWWRFDQALDHLGYLRERFWFPEKRIGAATPGFIFHLRRPISGKHNYSRLRILLFDDPDHSEAVSIAFYTEAQILNHYLVFGRAEQLLSLLHLTSGIYFVSVQREVLAHGKADRLFIVDDQEARHGDLSGRALITTRPHLSQPTRDSLQRSE